MPESTIVVTTDDEFVRAVYPDGATYAVRWHDIVRVSIETNDTGPLGADFWWIVEGTKERCTYPLGSTGEGAAIDAYGARLPGFNWDAAVDALGSAHIERFICWEKHGAG